MSKFLIRYPEISIERWDFLNMDEVITAIRKSLNCLVIYEDHQSVNHLLFSKLDEYMLHSMIIMMCNHEELYKFMRLSVQATQKFKSSNKEGTAFIEQISAFIEKHTNKDIDRLHWEEEERTNSPSPLIKKYFDKMDRKSKNKKEGD